MSSNGAIIRHRPTVAGAVLAVGVASLPWAFGGVAPFSFALPVMAALALALALVGEWRETRRVQRARRVAALPALALAGLGVLALCQALPVPGGLVAWLSPARARLSLDSAAALGEPAGRLALSLTPRNSVTTGLLLIGLALAFVATALVARNRIDRRLLFATVLGVALAQVVFGVPRWMARTGTLWGLDLPGVDTRLRGSYVNANHLALLLELGLVLTFAWGAWVARRTSYEPSAERRLLALAVPAGLWLLLFAGLVFTGSRAGLLAAVVATGIQAFGLGRRRRWLGPLVVAGLLAVGLGVALWLGGGAGFDRLAGTSVYDVKWSARLAVYRSTFDLWTRFPIVGSGLGSFLEAFPLVQPADLPGAWTHAHNDPLELLATGGVVGLALLVLGLVAVLRRLRGVLAEGRRSEDRFGALAALGALAAVGIHELLDFGLTLPANSLALVVLVAAATSARRDPTATAAPL